MLLTSVVLIIITASFSILSYLNQVSQFREQRNIIQQRQRQEINGLIDQSLLRLQHLSELIQSLKGMPSALSSGDPTRLHAAFDRHWTDLQIRFGLDIGRIYDNNDRLLAAWGQTGLPGEGGTEVPVWVKRANRHERPVTALNCDDNCELYAVSPLLLQGSHIGVILLGNPLTDIVLGFKQISKADIGLMRTEQAGGQSTVPVERRLVNWQARILALTDLQSNRELLQLVAERNPELNALRKGVTVAFRARQFEVTMIPVTYDGQATGGFFVVIADITEPLGKIHDAIKANLLLGGLGLVFSELLLVALLWTPMTRLRLTAETLPLLGVGAFEQARRSIRKRSQKLWFRDEVDVLDETAIALSIRLENLEQDVHDRTRALNERMQELRRERDFIHHLLNTAQVIILTQDENHSIQMFNHYGEILSGFHTDEIVNAKSFGALINPEDFTIGVASDMRELVLSQREQYRHESRLVCRDGANRDIAWLHSRLGTNTKESSIILSIGLDITDQKQAEQRLSWLADHDPLTRLFNRRRFQVELDRALAESRRYGNEGGLLFFDLDQFKYINDTSGHQAGDMLLKVVANTLSHLVRDTDVVGRLGGDEFAVLIGHTDKEGAIRAADKISEALCAIHLPVGERSYRISVSAGIALFPYHGTDVYELLANADIAMYQAKERGRNRWHLFSNEDSGRERMRAQVYWKERVEEALQEDQFILYYQPIMDLKSSRITHVEALLRMEDKDEPDGLIRPDAFIDACERSGLIHAIDHMVLRKGIDQIAQFCAAGQNVRISLNLSGRAFEDPDLLTILSNLLARTNIDPGLLIFEITETAAVVDFVAARSLMNTIRQMGCSFALDDFGTGFSSLRYLNQLPADYVKIDGSFVRDLSNSREKQVLVKAVADVARGFGKKTVAEYVESNDMVRVLRSFGVDFAQGYFVGRPVSAKDLFDLLTARRQIA